MSEIHRIKCGNSNCYIVENGTSGILVDTGKKEFLNKVIEQCKAYNVKLIVLTHAHFDHAENAAQISNALGIPIGMNEMEYKSKAFCRKFFGENCLVRIAQRVFSAYNGRI